MALSVCAHVYQSNYGLTNSRHSTDSLITPDNVATLTEAWRFTTAGDVLGQATTATVNGNDVVFFNDAAGYVYCVYRATGGLIWKKQVSTITGIGDSYSRNAPAFYDNKIYMGDQKSGRFWCLNAVNGDLIWSTLLDPHPQAIITQSATVDRGYVYVGLSSNDANRLNPTFQGNLNKLDALTGQLIWKTKAMPDNFGRAGGYTGAGIWGSSPSLDYSRNSVYVATGNNYMLPQSVIDCVNNPAVTDKNSCQDPNNHVDSIISIDITTGAIKWARNWVGIDFWNTALCPNEDSCNTYQKDFDFAQGPILFTVNGVDAIGCGNKGGTYYAVNRDTGADLWRRQVGVGTAGGGMLHGSSADGNHIYVANTNVHGNGWRLKNGQMCYTGYWTALNKNTGEVVWETCNPIIGRGFGPVTSVRGGLVFVGSLDATGAIYALRATDGQIVWRNNLGATVGAGAALTDDYLFWGCGYSKWGIGTPGRRFSAFRLGNVGSPLPTTTAGPGTTAPPTVPTTVSPTGYDTRGCWTCPAGFTHWFQAGIATAPGGDECACVPAPATTAPPSTPTTTAPTVPTTVSPTGYDTRGCWTCPAGFTHWFQAGIATAPGGDKCACVPAPATASPTTTTTRAPTPSTTAPTSSTTAAPTAYDTRGCWTCPAGFTHWFQVGIASAPGGDRCACVPYSGTPTTTAPTATTTRAPTPSTAAPTAYDTRGCWTCPAGSIHWFQAGIATAPGGDRCACVPTQGAPTPSTAAPTAYDTRGCWTCPAGFTHWFRKGIASAPGGDQCACVPN